MIQPLPADPRRRAERKANLLLASEMLRGQALIAVDELGGRADRVALRVQAVRAWFSNPTVLAVASGGAALFAGLGRARRGRVWRGLRWAWLAWRLLRGRRRR